MFYSEKELIFWPFVEANREMGIKKSVTVRATHSFIMESKLHHNTPSQIIG